MKKVYTSLFSILVLLAMTFMVSCEGPEGPAGEDGADGSTLCMTCHNEGTAFAVKTTEFNLSAHALGTYYSRSGECSGCHSTDGYLARKDFTSIMEIYDLAVPEQAPISCRTCHNVHMEYDETDWALTFVDPITETLFGTKSPDYESVALADAGDANMCLQCHQARDRGNVPAADATGNVTTGSTHWGPHYGVQGNVINSLGGIEVTGSETYPTGAVKHDCMFCHMNGGSHTLEVNLAYSGWGANSPCLDCHTVDWLDTNIKGTQEEVEHLKHELGSILAAQGVASVSTETTTIWDGTEHVTTIDTTGFGPMDMEMTADQAKALWNYMVVYQDHSYGVHNPSYIKALLKNSIALVE